MAYINSNQLWNGANFKSPIQQINDLDPNNYLVSELLKNFPTTTTYNELIYNSENYNKLNEIFENIEVIESGKKSKIVFGTQQVISEKVTELGQSYFVNNPQPVLETNPNIEVNNSNKIFTWGYSSTDRPYIKDIQSEPYYIANVPLSHISRGTDVKIGVSVMAKEDITTALSLNVNLYRQVVDTEGNVQKTNMGNLGTVVVDGAVSAEQTISIRQGHFAQSFVNLSLGSIYQTSEVAAVTPLEAPIGDFVNTYSLNIGSFTNSDFLMDDPIEFINSSRATGSDFGSFSGYPASSVSYFIGLENKDEVTSNGTGVVIVSTDLLTPGGGTRYLCEFYNYSNGTDPMILSIINCWNFTDRT